MTDTPVLQVRDLTRHFPVGGSFLGRHRRWLRAVDGVSFDVGAGETFGIVGESGCGKSTLALLLMALERPTSGTVLYHGEDAFGLSRGRRRGIQMVSQDPYSSLDPRMTIRKIVREPFDIHPDLVPPGDRDARVSEMLDLVGLGDEFADRYPHELSGGQRQRVSIARGLALEPDVLICDEPVSALDVSIQAQILNLIRDLQARLGLTCIFISHDLAVVRQMVDRLAVMYLGEIVELGDADEIYAGPAHPYTKALLDSAPSAQREARSLDQVRIIEGDLPDPADPPAGCRFHTRCWRQQERCEIEHPRLSGMSGSDREYACHFPLYP